MTRRLPTFFFLFASLLTVTSLARAQGGSTAASLSGTVADSSGALIPGADIVAQNDATGVKYTALTGDSGAFTIPVLPGGCSCYVRRTVMSLVFVVVLRTVSRMKPPMRAPFTRRAQ